MRRVSAPVPFGDISSQVLSRHARGWVKRLDPDGFAESPLCTVGGGHFPSGLYTVLYKGRGTIEFRGGVKVDPWFCMPHLADDDFVRQFAVLVKERLDPSLKVYVEYSNEVWNGQFKQAHHAMEQGKKLGLSEKDAQAGWAYTAVRSMEIFAIWR
jgi:hypothetical protein